MALIGGSWRVMAVLGCSGLLLSVHGGHRRNFDGKWRFLASLGGSWRLMAAYGGTVILARYLQQIYVLTVYGGLWRRDGGEQRYPGKTFAAGRAEKVFLCRRFSRKRIPGLQVLPKSIPAMQV